MGTIWLLNSSNDIEYNHTYYFTTATQQFSFFSSLAGYTSSNFKHLRYNEQIRINLGFESASSYNYMIVKNDNDVNYRYYFITSSQYVNQETTLLNIQYDSIQNNIIKWTLKTCFVEREHVADDSIGLHTLQENLYVEYDAYNYTPVIFGRQLAIIIGVSQLADGTYSGGSVYNGVYSGLLYFSFANEFSANTFIDSYVQAGTVDAITEVYMCPRDFISNFVDGGQLTSYSSVQYTETVAKWYSDLDGYTPINNKMYVYPYNFLRVSNANGGIVDYAYEDFNTSNCQLIVDCAITGNVESWLRPLDYKTSSPTIANFDESISISNFPQGGWNTDVYSNWKAQNSISNVASLTSSAISLGTGIATGNPLAIAGGVIGATQTIGNFASTSLTPNRSNGSNSGCVRALLNVLTYHIFNFGVKGEVAREIDEFFTKFGYKVNRLKVPDLTSRPNFNYVKTQDCNITSPGNQDDIRNINNAFDRGITFWKGDFIGDYSLNNQP